jgi:tight adherence protein C
MGKVRLRLVQAGYRGEEAMPIFYGARFALAFGAFVLLATPLVFRPNVMMGLGGSLLSYVLPGMVLARMAKRRQHRIQLSLADALDLLVVSVEAGLGLDQALLRVGDELRTAHPDLSEELRLVNLELRAGKARSEALRNLADRTGLEDIGSLVTMLVQTDKFGTSVAQSLRVHSDTLRTKRRQRAEEAAAKTGVKMVFPLVFCIFPAIWVVTIGPAAIKFVQVLFPMAHNIRPH